MFYQRCPGRLNLLTAAGACTEYFVFLNCLIAVLVQSQTSLFVGPLCAVDSRQWFSLWVKGALADTILWGTLYP
jgi:hypothetical protein